MKKLMLICAPVSSRSGYGDHARDLVRAFIKLDKFEVKILLIVYCQNQRWIHNLMCMWILEYQMNFNNGVNLILV